MKSNNKNHQPSTINHQPSISSFTILALVIALAMSCLLPLHAQQVDGNDVTPTGSADPGSAGGSAEARARASQAPSEEPQDVSPDMGDIPPEEPVVDIKQEAPVEPPPEEVTAPAIPPEEPVEQPPEREEADIAAPVSVEPEKPVVDIKQEAPVEPPPEEVTAPAIPPEEPVEQPPEREEADIAAPVSVEPEEPAVDIEQEAPVEPQPEEAAAPAIPPEEPVEQPPEKVEAGEEGVEQPQFELDRGERREEEVAPSRVQEEPEPEAPPSMEKEEAPVEEGVEAAQPKRSFWGRLFGRKDEKAEQEVSKIERVPAEKQPDVPTTALELEEKILTPEEMLAIREEIRRQTKEIEALKSFDKAYQAMRKNKFDDALKYFNDAMNVMPKRPHTVSIRQKAMKSQADCEHRIALENYRNGRIEEAKKAISRALSYYPAHRKADRLRQRIARDERERIERAARPQPPVESEAYIMKQQKIKVAFELGKQYMALREYEKAKYEFRRVLIEDELNAEAAANLRKIAEMELKLGTDQMDRMKAEMLAKVRETWTPPVKQEISVPKPFGEPGPITEPDRRRLLEKLNNIIIPQLDFRQANIVDVIKYLDQQSIAGDKDSPPTERGVNIILNLKRPGMAGQEALVPSRGEEDFFAPAETPTIRPDAGVPLITLSLRNIKLIDAIKYITEVTGLKFRIEKNAVIITPADVVYGEVITRTYKVQPGIQEIIVGAPTGEGAEGFGGLVELGAGPTVERGDVKRFFVEAGVPFPEGTSIVYKPSLNLLIVSNTSENLERFERILATLNVIPIQVEIEARFVEVSQTDLEELGMEWMLSDDWQIAQDASASAAVPLSALERLQIDQNTLTKSFRYLGGTPTTALTGGELAGIFSISSVLTNPELTFILHALEQRDGVNLLSAPKVTTKSGSNAEIKVVKELIYPTEFLQQVQSVGVSAAADTVSDLTQVVVTPSGFETRDLGVVLNVTPVVGPDNYTIDLTMLPQVVELAEWINYGSSMVNPDGSISQMNMPQPIFHSRSIATSISIWDGQTVVMGGLITEGQSTTEDKVPFLGDIPLLGYLFRSKTSKSVKRNLLIFVTAYIVDPAGNRINKPTEELTHSLTTR